MFSEAGHRCSPERLADATECKQRIVFVDDVTDETKMKNNTRIMTLWAVVILLWTCCLFMTCLFLNDVICAEEELCDHVDDDVVPLGDGRKSGIYREYYEDLANDSDPSDVIELRTTHRIVLLYRKPSAKPWTIPEGDYVFRRHSCPVAGCVLSQDVAADLDEADAVLLRAADIRSRDDLPPAKPPHQIWLLTLSRPPDHVLGNLSAANGLVNWTSTYSDASDIHRPFGVYRRFDDDDDGGGGAGSDLERILSRWSSSSSSSSAGRGNASAGRGRIAPRDGRRWDDSILAGKTRLVAMFTNDCKLAPRHRAYVERLAKHVRVDLYGGGQCTRRPCGTRRQCLDMLRGSYRFYLAFEESDCRQYITDRFWRLALGHDLVPVVMGPPRVDYDRLAPPHSFLHVDDFPSPAQLAKQLVRLAANSSLYERYFDWKQHGYVEQSGHVTGDRNFWCRLCAKLHDRNSTNASQVYAQVDKWWSYHKQCAR